MLTTLGIEVGIGKGIVIKDLPLVWVVNKARSVSHQSFKSR